MDAIPSNRAPTDARLLLQSTVALLFDTEAKQNMWSTNITLLAHLNLNDTNMGLKVDNCA
jgi:hypothetical protein